MSEIIIRNPITILPDDNLNTVNKLINGEGLDHIPVVEEGRLLGVISKSDLTSRYLKIMEKGNNCDQSMEEINAAEIMNTEPVTVLVSDGLDKVMEVYLSNDVQTLIVVDEKNSLQGLITSFGLLGYVLAA